MVGGDKGDPLIGWTSYIQPSITVIPTATEHGAWCMINTKQIGWRGGETILHTAVVYESYLEQVKLLIRYGADVNARADDGSTPLHYACKSATVILVLNGADVNAKANNGRTPLHVAVHNDWPQDNNWPHSLLLVCLGARIDSISSAYMNLIHSKNWICSKMENPRKFEIYVAWKNENLCTIWRPHLQRE